MNWMCAVMWPQRWRQNLNLTNFTSENTSTRFLVGSINPLVTSCISVNWQAGFGRFFIGNSTHFGLGNRDILSIRHCSHSFVAKGYDCPPRVWHNVKEELVAFRGALVFAVASRIAPWRPMYNACDSSLEGYSVQSLLWASSDVRETGLRKDGG